MRVLLLSPSFEDRGGVASFCRILMKHASPEFEIDHLEIGNRPGNRNPVRRLSFLLGDAARLRRSLKSNSYDLVHINPSMEILSLLRDSFYLFYVSRIGRARSLVLFHGWNERLAGRLLAVPAFRSGFRAVYAKAGMVLALCRSYKSLLERLGLDPGRVAVATTMFEAGGDSATPKAVKPQRVRILFMARLWKSKGVYIALDVARLLVSKGMTNFRLTIAGDGPELEGVRKRRDSLGLKEHVLVPGYLEGDQKREALENSDVFLYPTFYGEGCPVVILEAMGFGLAIVSTPVAAIPEIVENGTNGFLVNSREAEDFVLPVERLMADPDLLEAIRSSNRKKALENYEAAVVTAKFESIYLSVIRDLPDEGRKKHNQEDPRENGGATGRGLGK